MDASCVGVGCCLYSPTWPAGSASSQPQCPFAGQDPNGNGILDAGETWGGVCDHAGACSACGTSLECADTNPCTIDTCNALGSCEHDATSRAGLACTETITNDALCTVIGAGQIACQLKNGAVCATDQECVSSHCANGLCCDTACAGTCQRCDSAGSAGTCASIPALCTGTCAACAASGSCEAAVAGCSGTCGVCSQVSATDFSCAASAGSCTGNCDVCSQASATAFNCAASAGLCTGNCDTCSQVSATRFDCAATAGMCTGNCGVCGLVSATQFDCAGGAGCTGNCSVCGQVSATQFACAANDAACTGTCQVCSLAGADASCAYVTPGLTDPGTCTAPQQCGTSGACGLADGTLCSSNAECLSANCECTTASCEAGVNRVCAASNCVCKYGAAGACTTNMPNTGYVDPEDCGPLPAHCYNGACTGSTPGTCAGNNCQLGGTFFGVSSCGFVSVTNGCNTGWAPSGLACIQTGPSSCAPTGWICTCAYAP